jgi:hypothetical protein
MVFPPNLQMGEIWRNAILHFNLCGMDQISRSKPEFEDAVFTPLQALINAAKQIHCQSRAANLRFEIR